MNRALPFRGRALPLGVIGRIVELRSVFTTAGNFEEGPLCSAIRETPPDSNATKLATSDMEIGKAKCLQTLNLIRNTTRPEGLVKKRHLGELRRTAYDCQESLSSI